MARYKPIVKQSLPKDLRTFPKKNIARILTRTEALRDDPRPSGCEERSGQERCRIRQGAHGIICRLLDEQVVVTVVKAAHRKQVYKRN